MSSGAIRDPLADHLITPQSAAIAVINYRPLSVAHRRVLSRKRDGRRLGARRPDDRPLRQDLVTTTKDKPGNDK
jgi:hypothetical protein